MRKFDLEIRTVRGSFWWFSRKTIEERLEHKFFGPYLTPLELQPGLYNIKAWQPQYPAGGEQRGKLVVEDGSLLIGDPFWNNEIWGSLEDVLEEMKMSGRSFEVVLGRTGSYRFSFELSDRQDINEAPQTTFWSDAGVTVK